MSMASDDSRMHARAILTAACLQATANLIGSGNISVQGKGNSEVAELCALYACEMLAKLAKPADWTI